MRLFFIALLVLNLFYFGLQLRDDLDWQAAHPPTGVLVPAATPGLRVLRKVPVPSPAPEAGLARAPAPAVTTPWPDGALAALVLAPPSQLLPFAVALPVLQPGLQSGSFARQARCRRYGPLGAREEQQTLLASLVRNGWSVRAHSSQQPRVRLYMVYVRMTDREAAVRRLQQLRAQGLEDIRLIEAVGTYRDISLGVFSSRRIAERRLRNLARAGVQAQIAPYGRGRVQTQYWLDVMMEALPGAPVQPLDSLTDALTHQPLDCREFVP